MTTEADKLGVWQLLFDTTYAPGGDAAVGEATVGWNSSFTGEPFTAEEMTEWAERTVERIRGLAPRNLLEIGCGVGLLARLLQDDVESYHGTDFSESALRSARDRLSPRMELSLRHAADFTGLAPGSRDTVVINSVAQYFPDATYLLQVLEGAIETTRDGGAVFLGDLRNKALLEVFHGAVELHRAPDGTAAEEIRDRAAGRLAVEKELVVAPGFFLDLVSRHPRLSGADIALKRGSHPTEMNCFRYDVTLYVGPPADDTSVLEAVRMPWTSADEAAVLLGRRRPDAAVITGVPNRRTAGHIRAWHRILEGGVTARTLRAERADDSGIDPEVFFPWAERRGYEAKVGWWLDGGGSGTYDVVLRRRGVLDGVPPSALLGKDRPEEVRSADTGWFAPYVNQPYSEESAVAGLRGDESVTETIVAVWRQVLKRQDIDQDANFFDLGGNSLMLVHVLKQLRTTVGPDLQLVDLFNHTTVSGLARYLEQGDAETAEVSQKSAADRRRAMRRQRARHAPRVEG